MRGLHAVAKVGRGLFTSEVRPCSPEHVEERKAVQRECGQHRDGSTWLCRRPRLTWG